MILQHGDDVTATYAHLSQISVMNGQEVKQGDVIGLVGRTGAATGAHLHYELLRNQKPFDPMSQYLLDLEEYNETYHHPFIENYGDFGQQFTLDADIKQEDEFSSRTFRMEGC